jgi:hypothetical protein
METWNDRMKRQYIRQRGEAERLAKENKVRRRWKLKVFAVLIVVVLLFVFHIL